MKEIIVRMTGDHIKVKGGEYVRDYEPRKGVWNKQVEDGWTASICSECGYRMVNIEHRKHSFCPNCGADMREDQ